ncbi:interleukin-7 isoform X2 [Anolis sagrei]|uniref:interleukin-7 isoform X2 n=1 Tax=Anolis sagrei TaxID=38937 RepID=UPI00351FC2C8
MVHAFLRNVFWIVPLFLVLVTDASSPCMDREAVYRYMLSIDLEQLEHSLQNTSDFRGLSCNSTKAKALRCMARCLKNISETCITSNSELQDNMSSVSKSTLKLLRQECNTTIVKKTPKGKCCHCRDRYQTSDMINYTKKIVSDIKTCWIQIIR